MNHREPPALAAWMLDHLRSRGTDEALSGGNFHAEPIACPTYRNDVLRDTEADASDGAAATRRTCCIELLEAKPSPQIAAEHAISG